MMLAEWLKPCLQQVQTLKKGNALSHALLITGADGVGQESLAHEMVKDLMCESDQGIACGVCHSCELMNAETHPDYRVLDGENGTIKVDQVRSLVQKISQKPQVGKSKITLITHAEEMNVNAANALLKALEEPAENTFFILTTSQSKSLLPTIRSRCLLVSIPTPSLSDVQAWLSQLPEHSELQNLFWLTTQPFRLLSLQQQGKVSLYADLPSKLVELLQGRMSVSDVLKGVDTSNIEDYTNGLGAILHQCILHSAGGNLESALQEVYPILISRISIQGLMVRYTALQQLKEDLQKTNLNPIMQLTYELNQW
ncbi:DNA polymerase III subunit delta' [Marinomonas sp. C2222]|uniref:DNA-directed DNA polymerase n=1 Tax=Marinomonas sargassi TaxID=2984494 RepID=A0ABT2YSI2_9GAMM|nr:DNA polymerase III subunit delta' [Marinomonas sargassi]MCV2402858.1 DNA polymerase III subunit delta' [Marinomonas sargassi]